VSNTTPLFGPNYAPDFLIASTLSDGNLGINAWNVLSPAADVAIGTTQTQILGTQVGNAWQGQGYMQICLGLMKVVVTAACTVQMYVNINGVAIESDMHFTASGQGSMPCIYMNIFAPNAVYDIFMYALCSVGSTATAKKFGNDGVTIGTVLLSLVMPFPILGEP
jgi:hypothetical protein